MRPYTLTNTKTNIRNCTSTSRHPHNPHTPPQRGDAGGHTGCRSLDARNHYPQIKHHTPPPKRGDNQSHPIRRPGRKGLVASKPNSVSSDSRRRPISRSPPPTRSLRTRTDTHYRHRPIHRIAQNPVTPQSAGRPWVSWCSLERR